MTFQDGVFVIQYAIRTHHYAQQYAPKLLSENLKVALAEKDAADKAIARGSGGNNNPTGIGGRSGKVANPEFVNVDNIHVDKRPSGTSQSAALRRLRNQAPELHARVLNGELSPHAAMIEAGFRPKTFTVRADDPVRIAATLRRNLTPHVLDALIKLFENG